MPPSTSCSVCGRAVWTTDVDGQGRCNVCSAASLAPGETQTTPPDEPSFIEAAANIPDGNPLEGAS